MAVGVAARPFLTRAGTGALVCVASVGGNLPFARHGQAAVERSLAASSSRRTPLATMPSQEPDRSAEAIRRVLPELRKLDRYERRADAQRDRAVRGSFGRRNSMDNL